ncbi:MAG: Acetophenone carboxylase gamma subunit [Alphaproteobacteria bacterium MarineAlpha4_Bin2]|nr:MAG: Acetophenone carboxylase gamma subunit [Alphaproteobacteria bacterium MarineAlpha4_Bin2]
MGLSLGSDIGGTFTDFALVDGETGDIRIHKRLTTSDDPSKAVATGVAALLVGQAPNLETHIHGTTLVINAVIERKGARTGLITTEGFRDVIQIGREKRYDGWDLKISFPKPLIDRALRLEVLERVHADGRVLKTLDQRAVRAAVTTLQSEGVESIAVCLLHAYKNPIHEQMVRAAIEEIAPNVPVSLSSEVLPEINEYERVSTTAVNAYTKPATASYLSRLEERMVSLGADSELLLMQSSGGINSSETARDFPVRIIESGPAAGALGAAHYARLAGLGHVLSFDMGGTTAKMCLVQDGRVSRTTEFEVAHVHRFKRGSGIPVRVPVLDLMEIGAGGGSLAHISEVGTLQVGPESAGADPGPACYGQGGIRPSVSDADLVLGYLDPDHFLGGEMLLDKLAAEVAIRDEVATPLDLEVTEAAFGIHGIVNENMAAAAKVYVTEHGEDPTFYTLVAFGGCGPVHAVDLARRLGIKSVLIPPRAGVASAIGMVVAPVSYDTVRTNRVRVEVADFCALEVLFAAMASECESRMPPSVDKASLDFERCAEMRYVGQGYNVAVPLPNTPLTDASAVDVQSWFDGVYRKLYGRTYDDLDLEFINLRLTATAPMDEVRLAPAAVGPSANPITRRDAYCPVQGCFVPHSVYQRFDLGPGFASDGPVIIQENEATTIVGTDGKISVDAHGSLLIEIFGGAA